jgi:predicted RNase H-like HicB family nuclease
MSIPPEETLEIQIEYFTGTEEEDDIGHPYYVASNDTVGVVTDGETFEELLVNLKEALETAMEGEDTLALYNVAPNPRIILRMEMPGHYAKTA